MSDFEMKKVQKVKGSFFIYLPKKWCLQNNLNHQEKPTLLLKQLTPKSILIQPSIDPKNTELPYCIDFEIDEIAANDLKQKETIEYKLNLILTAYITGFKKIIINCNNKFPIKIKNRIYRMIKTRFIGMVILSESQNQIILEEHLDQIDIHALVKQLMVKVGLLMENSIELIENLKQYEDVIETINDIIEQDDQIDGYRYAIERFVHQILDHPKKILLYKISIIECLHYSETARSFERIGDHIIKIITLLKVKTISDKKFIIIHLSKMKQTYKLIEENFWETDTFKLFHLIREIMKYSKEVKQLIFANHADNDYLIPIRRIGNICSDIAEIRINDNVSNP
ncbi:MAG: PhoU domain-containing protein [Promethearchaeota archaeon]